MIDLHLRAATEAVMIAALKFARGKGMVLIWRWLALLFCLMFWGGVAAAFSSTVIPDQPISVQERRVTIHIMPRDQFREMAKKWGRSDALGFTLDGNPCVIWAIPDWGVLIHELRHCFGEKH